MSWSFRTNGNFVDFVHTDETSLAVENTLRSLHTTSNCVEWSFGSDSARLTFKVDDLTFENVLAADVDVDGTQLTDAADFPDAIRAVFTGLGGGSSYLSYVAKLNQTSTNAPIATEQANTLNGDISFVYVGDGAYNIVSTEAEFLASKVVFIYPSIVAEDGGFMMITRTNDTTLSLTTWAAEGDGTYTASNDYLINWPIEIRVYP